MRLVQNFKPARVSFMGHSLRFKVGWHMGVGTERCLMRRRNSVLRKETTRSRKEDDCAFVFASVATTSNGDTPKSASFC